MSHSTFCVHRGGNIIDSPRNIGLITIRLIMMMMMMMTLSEVMKQWNILVDTLIGTSIRT